MQKGRNKSKLRKTEQGLAFKWAIVENEHFVFKTAVTEHQPQQ